MEQQNEKWEELLDSRRGEICKIDFESFRKQFKQFMEHPTKNDFIDRKYNDSYFTYGRTMLICVIENKRLDLAKLLLEHGADINIGDKEGETSLIKASFLGHDDGVKLLLENGADITIADKYGETALIKVCKYGVLRKYSTVKLLVENGADVNITDKKGCTALMNAIEHTNTSYGSYHVLVDTVKLLLDKGTDITIASNDGETALMKAKKKYRYDEIILLLELTANPNMRNSNGQTFLHQACLQNMKTLAQHALEVGIEKDTLDYNEHTALFYAAEKGFADIVDLLMKHSVDADKTDERKLITRTRDYMGITTSYSFYSVKDGRTPLFAAAQNGHIDAVASLLQHGADPWWCNHESKIPRDVSEVHGAIQQLFHIHHYFDQREKGFVYQKEYYEYKTCEDGGLSSCGSKGKVPALEDIIHEIVKYPHYADKFLELYQENQEIVDWLDEDGRPVRQVACKECREVILFMGRYHLDDQPNYESPTCKIYNALDYGGPDENLKQPRNVAMKFFEEEEHFDNEMRSRRNEDGSPRFSSDFVTPDLAAYRADKNPKYAKACKTWKSSKNGSESNVLPGHCIVMPQAKRSLLESMNAENLSAPHKDLHRREILFTLCKIFSHIHQVGHVHGDIKPHNVVRHMDGGDVTWKAIDFDACTKIGESVGLKLTTGSVPPEMLKIVNGEEETKIVLRQPGADGLDGSDFVKADPSFDVWSFGILMYELVTGGSFFHCDKQGNVVDSGLHDWANLTQQSINKKLASVEDVNARLLLSRILRVDPEERPAMSDIEKDYYFHPSESPQGRKAEFFGKQVFSIFVPKGDAEKLEDTKSEQSPPLSTLEEKDEQGDENVEELKRFLISAKSEFSFFNLRDEDKDWSDQLLNSEVENFRFDNLEGMGKKPKFIDGDSMYNNELLRSLLSNNGPDYFMGFLVEYFQLYEIMNDAHQVCQGIKANLVSDVKSLKGIFIKLFVRGKGLNDVVRGTLFCNSIDQFKYVGRQLKEQYGRNVYIKPPKSEAGAWPIPKLLIYGNKQIDGRCMSVEIQFSTVYMHLAVHASNNHLVYEAMRESTGYLNDKDEEFHQFLQSLNRQHIDTEGFLRNESAKEGRFEVLVEKAGATDNGGANMSRQDSDQKYISKETGVILGGRIRCGDLKFRFLSPTDRFQRFSESSFVVNKSLTLLSSHSYWSEESFDLEGKMVEFVVSFKGRGLAIAGIGTVKCFHGRTERDVGGERCSVQVGRSKFVVRKSGIEKVFQEKKLPNQEKAKITFKMKDGVLSVSFVESSGRDEGDEETTESQVSMPTNQRYYLYMRAPPGVHDVKFHDINIK